MKKQEIYNFFKKLSNCSLNEFIAILSLSGSIGIFLGVIRGIIYKSKSAQFYNLPSYLFEMDIYEYLYIPLLVTVICIIWSLFLFINKNKTNKFFKFFMIIFFLPITAIFLTLFAWRIYFNFFNFEMYYSFKYNNIVCWIVLFFIYAALGFCMYNESKNEKIKKIKDVIFILTIALMYGNLLIQFSLEPSENKKYEILENENKIVISLYQNNYVAMNYTKINEIIEIDTSSYFLIPISNQKLKYLYFKKIKKSPQEKM
ncbi:MAG: hypothetical protein ACRCYA_01640 [Cetobacterium sp.]|uniref:hypothetical protein n=1 Tax=Cetobacterium sp. TaxID=2071632 RepID=UPI003F367773